MAASLTTWVLSILLSLVVFALRGSDAELTNAHRIVVVGDLHGDLESTMEVLREAQVIDCNSRWVTGTDTVIQIGDVLDRGPHGHEIMEFFAVLQEDARRNGGEFEYLIGNHEVMNLQGDLKFTHVDITAAFGGEGRYRAAFAPDGPYGKVLASLNTALIRNDTLFVHAGLLPAFAKAPIDTLNSDMRDMIRHRKWNHSFNFADSPVWTRELLHSAQRGNCRAVLDSLRRVSDHEVRQGRREVTRMIIGHTIQPLGEITAFCNGSLVAIDVCLSQFMGPTCGWMGSLELHLGPNGGSEIFAHYPPVRRRALAHRHVRPPKWLLRSSSFSSNNRMARGVGDEASPPPPNSPYSYVYQDSDYFAYESPSQALLHDLLVMGAIVAGLLIWYRWGNLAHRRAVALGKKEDLPATLL